MKAIVTGMHGTVAPAVATHLKNAGVAVIPWDRNRVPIDNYEAMEHFIVAENPAWFFHIATGNPIWAQTVAELCHKHKIRFMFTSSVSVFATGSGGPFTIQNKPNATDAYGLYKIECENRVRTVNPDVIIARLGWQIGDSAGSNNMVDFLAKTNAETGHVEVSTCWYPSCSFLSDTASALYRLMLDGVGGLFHLEGNPGLTFSEIACSLNELHGRPWKIIKSDNPEGDNRLLDDRVKVASIQDKLQIQKS